jgi:ribosome biogenesis protein SSF1/2
MNSLQTVPQDTQDPDQQATRRLESLVADLFRSLFPQISPMATPLTSVKRVLLLNREVNQDKDSKDFTLTFRHYSINTKRAGLPRPIKRINAAEKVHKNERKGKGIPNLGHLEDVSEYFLDAQNGNFTSASESEPDTDAEVEILAPREKRIHYKEKLEKIRAAQNGSTDTPLLPGTGEVEKRGIILSELGPRMKLRLIKVEEGLCEGKILWHNFIAKTKEEERATEKMWEKRKKEKDERKRVQKENIERKKAVKKQAEANGKPVQDDDEDEDFDDWEAEDFDDYNRMDEDEPEMEE